MNPPPYFPTTGRFLDNRYYELDPNRVNRVTGRFAELYQSLTPRRALSEAGSRKLG